MPTLAEISAALPDDISLDREIFGGGQRRVFIGERNGTPIVLKLMDDIARPRAEREVAAGYGVKHPNLAEIFDDEVIDLAVAGETFCYFTEEFIDGTQLRSIVGGMDECAVLRMIDDLAAAVDYLWSTYNIVHRDIKPDNIIRALDGRYVLLDVGIGRHQRQPSLTTPMFAPGTPGYYAPEQVNPSRRQLLDFRADLFLIGITAVEMLTGSVPFDPLALDYVRQLFGGVGAIPGTSAETTRILQRLLAPRPHQRYSRLPDLSAEIAAARGALGCI